eukprot:GHVN01096447.1.p1 GENE.GHVN01096447.1~~GHVN01096447.1.p1  ORF type:complete len:1515 (+),score=381.55 GHVN01096447.1:45-4589(+)
MRAADEDYTLQPNGAPNSNDEWSAFNALGPTYSTLGSRRNSVSAMGDQSPISQIVRSPPKSLVMTPPRSPQSEHVNFQRHIPSPSTNIYDPTSQCSRQNEFGSSMAAMWEAAMKAQPPVLPGENGSGTASTTHARSREEFPNQQRQSTHTTNHTMAAFLGVQPNLYSERSETREKTIELNGTHKSVVEGKAGDAQHFNGLVIGDVKIDFNEYVSNESNILRSVEVLPSESEMMSEIADQNVSRPPNRVDDKKLGPQKLVTRVNTGTDSEGTSTLVGVTRPITDEEYDFFSPCESDITTSSNQQGGSESAFDTSSSLLPPVAIRNGEISQPQLDFDHESASLRQPQFPAVPSSFSLLTSSSSNALLINSAVQVPVSNAGTHSMPTHAPHGTEAASRTTPSAVAIQTSADRAPSPTTWPGPNTSSLQMQTPPLSFLTHRQSQSTHASTSQKHRPIEPDAPPISMDLLDESDINNLWMLSVTRTTSSVSAQSEVRELNGKASSMNNIARAIEEVGCASDGGPKKTSADDTHPTSLTHRGLHTVNDLTDGFRLRDETDERVFYQAVDPAEIRSVSSNSSRSQGGRRRKTKVSSRYRRAGIGATVAVNENENRDARGEDGRQSQSPTSPSIDIGGVSGFGTGTSPQRGVESTPWDLFDLIDAVDEEDRRRESSINRAKENKDGDGPDSTVRFTGIGTGTTEVNQPPYLLYDVADTGDGGVNDTGDGGLNLDGDFGIDDKLPLRPADEHECCDLSIFGLSDKTGGMKEKAKRGDETKGDGSEGVGQLGQPRVTNGVRSRNGGRDRGRGPQLRQRANVKSEYLEEFIMNTIVIIHNGQKTVVRWHSDTEAVDVREAILCACDSIIDSGFVLREVFPVDVNAPVVASPQIAKSVPVAPPCLLGGSDDDSEGQQGEIVELKNDGVKSQEREVSASHSQSGADKEKESSEGVGGGGEESGDVIDIEIEGKKHSVKKGAALTFEQFGDVKDGYRYILEQGSERSELQRIVGDRFRRLNLGMDPLKHIEAREAIRRMKRGANLLKHTRFGDNPHIRFFQLSVDCRTLQWFTAKKAQEKATVMLHEVTEISLGQQTPIFKRCPIPVLSHLSFSLIYGPQRMSLDLTCKDEHEYDMWIAGLKAVVYHIKSKPISKAELLNHSKRFRNVITQHVSEAPHFALTKLGSPQPHLNNNETMINPTGGDSTQMAPLSLTGASSQTPHSTGSSVPATSMTTHSSHVSSVSSVTLAQILELPTMSADDIERRIERLQLRLTKAVMQYKSKVIPLSSCSSHSIIASTAPLQPPPPPPPPRDGARITTRTGSVDVPPPVPAQLAPFTLSGSSTGSSYQPPQSSQSLLSGLDLEFLTSVNPAYNAVYRTSPSVEDIRLLDHRMNEMLELVSKRIDETRNGLIEYNRSHISNSGSSELVQSHSRAALGVQESEAPPDSIQPHSTSTPHFTSSVLSCSLLQGVPRHLQLKELGSLLWMAQVDLENVEDMITVRLRPIAPPGKRLSDQMTQKMRYGYMFVS